MQTIYIMRGIPGSGKTTKAKSIRDKTGAIICSADDFFIDNDGNYIFDYKKIGEAHEWCKKKAREALNYGSSIIIDNTNCRRWEFRPYIEMAREFGTKVKYVYPTWDSRLYRGDEKWNTDFIIGLNVHGTEKRKVEKMAAFFEWDTDEEKVLTAVRE